jgi:hypothetical protein
MSLGPYADDLKIMPAPQQPHPAPDASANANEPFTFGCGCVASTSDNGSYTVTWCPQHNRAHGDTRDLAAR